VLFDFVMLGVGVAKDCTTSPPMDGF
jgi:hypothetical protein